jgi:hypothetical protein
MNSENLDKVSAAFSIVFYAIFLAFIKFSGVSINYIVNIQNTVLKSMIIESAGKNTLSSVVYLLTPFLTAFVSLLVLVAALSFMCSYGYYKPGKKIGMITGIINAIVTIILFPSIIGVFIAVSAFVTFWYVVPLSNTYGMELKKWKKFRTGSNAVGKALLIFNIIVALGVLFSVAGNINVYKASFKEDLVGTATSITLESLPPESQMLGEGVLRDRISSSIENSKLFDAYIRWLPIISAFGLWVMLEFIRNIILSNVGGLFTYGFIGVFSKFDKK